ncbi:unnamed protein product [Rhizophagus irregularis]|nr:unnamed protein product [Rhizophagus irregularis]
MSDNIEDSNESFFNFNDTITKELVHELKLHRVVGFHENILHVYGVTTYDEDRNDQYLFVLEYADGGNYTPGFTLQKYNAVEISQGLREKVVPNTPSDYSNLYTECWNSEPVFRPTMKKVVERLKLMISTNQSASHPCYGTRVETNGQQSNDSFLQPPSEQQLSR